MSGPVLKPKQTGWKDLPSWTVILIYVAVSLFLGFELPRFEALYLPELTVPVSASAALTILGAIASGMLALTGIVFSLSFVMVQFSSAAYSPRLVQWMARDPVIIHSTGIFTSTFVYALGASAWIDRGGNGHVLFMSSLLAIIFLVASVFAFTRIIQRMERLQINNVLSYIGDRGREVIAEMYPPVSAGAGLSGATAPKPAGPWVQEIRYTGAPLVVAALDGERLVETARGKGCLVVLHFAVGSTVMEGDLLARVGGPAPLPEETLRRCIILNRERTFEQDPKYALRLLVDVAIKALSPAVNDPTTAVQALDQIEDHLRRLGQARLDVGRVEDASGALRLVFPVPSWEDFIRLAFEEIRTCGATSVQVMRRMREAQNALLAIVPEERKDAVRAALARLDATVGRSYADPGERSDALEGDRQGLGVPARDESGE